MGNIYFNFDKYQTKKDLFTAEMTDLYGFLQPVTTSPTTTTNDIEHTVVVKTITGYKFVSADFKVGQSGVYPVQQTINITNDREITFKFTTKTGQSNCLASFDLIETNEVVEPDPEPEPEIPEIPEPVEHVISVSDLTVFEHARVFINYNDVEFELTKLENAEVFSVLPTDPDTYNVRVVADSGYRFKTIPIKDEQYNADTGVIDEFEYTGTSSEQTRDFDFSYKFIDFSNLGFELLPVLPTENMPYTKVYKVDENQLNVISNYSYFKDGQEVKDYSRYISGLYSFPYNIVPDGVINNVLLGDKATTVQTHQMNDYIYDVNLGMLDIQDISTQHIGYKNIGIRLYVPFFDYIDLEIDEVLGYSISMKLKLNLMNGKGTLNIFSLRTNSIIHVETKQIGVKIPYTIGEKVEIIQNDVLLTEYNKPFIQLKVLKPDNEVVMLGTRVVVVDDEFEYLKDDDDISLKSFATEREQKMIKDNIRNGVFIRR